MESAARKAVAIDACTAPGHCTSGPGVRGGAMHQVRAMDTARPTIP